MCSSVVTSIVALSCIGIVLLFVDHANCHGRLLDPPARNTLWRKVKGQNIPTNYNDNELNCGGMSYQWDTHSGKCGVCGDPYGGVAKNVFPGKFATGYIGKTYKQGQVIVAKVEITSNHKGYFEFRVGDIIAPPITQQKLKYILVIEGTKETRYKPAVRNGIFYVQLKLPSDLVCDHCVLQWWYKAGNSWGCDAEGCGMGMGKQETFVNCADIKITPNGNPIILTAAPQTQGPNTEGFTVAPETEKPNPKTDREKTDAPVMTNPPGNKICTGKAAGPWANTESIDKYCDAYCHIFCPAPVCSCRYY